MAKQPFRILQIVTKMNRGGAETMIMNHYRSLPKDIAQFDFLTHRDEAGDYDDEIRNLGGRIFSAPAIRPWTYISYFRWLDDFFREHASEYIAVHGHIQENSGFAMYFAKKYGIKNRISSSHIADLGIDYKYIFRKFGAIWTNKYATLKLACGNDAGKFLYGKSQFQILKNAIDTDSFLFNPNIRAQKRSELSIPDDYIVIGNVARFSPQKNHNFMIHVFKKFHESNPNSVLVLVGEGNLMSDIKDLANKLDISGSILFLGLRSDIPQLLQAFDVFFMPSLFEGLPVSVIEAQASGLPCVLSDTIDKECDITGRVNFVSLESPISEWVRILEAEVPHKRKNCRKEIIEAGYDVNTNLKQLLHIYGVDN